MVSSATSPTDQVLAWYHECLVGFSSLKGLALLLQSRRLAHSHGELQHILAALYIFITPHRCADASKYLLICCRCSFSPS